MSKFNEWQETIIFNISHSPYIENTSVEDITVESLAYHIFKNWNFDGVKQSEEDHLKQKYISELTPDLITHIKRMKAKRKQQYQR